MRSIQIPSVVRLPVSVLIASVALAACGGGAGPGPAGPTPGGPPAPIAYQPLTAGLPPIPQVEAPLAIRVVHPTPGSTRPAVDSTFIYGNVGTGNAALVINGVQVPVAPNGAFIAYLPTPQDAWRLEAWKGGQQASASVEYRAPGPADAEARTDALPIPEGVLPTPRGATVTGGGDTLATGSDAVFARPTPTGTYRWFFPRGARLTVAERRGTQYRVQLDDGTSAWINASAVTLGDAAPAPAELRNVQIASAPGGEDLIVGTPWLPFLVEVDSAGVLRVTLYNATPGAPLRPGAGGSVIRGVTAAAAGARTVRLDLAMSGPVWGYKAFYRPDGALVVRVRQPPPIDAANPLRGIRVVVDPGHPPAGATGPTGLYEGDANLQIGLRLAERLRAAGAEVILTRTTRDALRSATNQSEELSARAELAVRSDAHLMVSVHNNAFGEGQNPFRAHHTSTYWFRPQSAALSRALNEAIAPVALIPNRGSIQNNFAVIRPTWLPTALTESLFMPIPEQESALRDPAFLDRLADAHFRGIEAFLRSAAASR